MLIPRWVGMPPATYAPGWGDGTSGQYCVRVMLKGVILRSPSTAVRINSTTKKLTLSLALHEILHLRPALAQNDNPPQIHLGGWHMTCSSESEPPVGRKE